MKEQGWEDMAINAGGGGARPQRPRWATPASTAFVVQAAKHQQRVFPQVSVRDGFAFESNRSGSSDV